MQGIAEHALRQGVVWREGTRAERVAGTIADGAASWRETKAMQVSFNTGREEVQAQVAAAGGDPAVATAALQDYDTRFHGAVIERQMVEDPAAARSYFERVRNAITPPVAARLDTRLTEVVADRRAIALAAAYRPDPSSAPGEPGPGAEPQLAAYEAHARQDAGGDTAQLVRNRTAMSARFRRDRAAWRDRRASGVQAGYDWVDANPGEPVLAMPPQVRDGMDAVTQAKVTAYAERGGRVATDWRRYHALQRFAQYDPEGFLDLDLTEEKSSLAPAHLATLGKLQVEVRQGDPEHALAHLRHVTETVDDYLHTAGVAPDAPSAEALRQRFGNELAAFEHGKGSRADLAEMQAVLDRLALRRMADGAAPAVPTI